MSGQLKKNKAFLLCHVTSCGKKVDSFIPQGLIQKGHEPFKTTIHSSRKPKKHTVPGYGIRMKTSIEYLRISIAKISTQHHNDSSQTAARHKHKHKDISTNQNLLPAPPPPLAHCATTSLPREATLAPRRVGEKITLKSRRTQRNNEEITTTVHTARPIPTRGADNAAQTAHS